MKLRGRQPTAGILFSCIAAAFCVLAVVLALLSAGHEGQGAQYIRQQEQKDPAEIQAQLDTRKNAEIQTGLENGTLNLGDSLGNYLVLGDSRARALSEYGYLAVDRNLAEIGTNYADMTDSLETIRQMQPAVILISYGANDLMIYTDADTLAGGYGTAFADKVKQIQAVSPNSRIIISSIFQVTPEVEAEKPGYQNRANFNEQLKKICEENGWIFVDNSSIEDQLTFEPDGTHLDAAGYATWLENIAKTYRESL